MLLNILKNMLHKKKYNEWYSYRLYYFLYSSKILLVGGFYVEDKYANY